MHDIHACHMHRHCALQPLVPPLPLLPLSRMVPP